MPNIQDYIQKLGDDSLSFDEQAAALQQIEQSLLKSQEKQEEVVQSSTDLVVEAVKSIEDTVYTKFKELSTSESMKGPKGNNGRDGKDGKDGKNGVGYNGKDGKDGIDGIDGEDGRYVTDVEIAFDDTLLVTLSDNTTIKTTKEIKGPKGDQGPQGLRGSNGNGVVVGGTTGQVLAKVSNTDYDVQWTSTPGLDLASPDAIGDVTPNTGKFTTLGIDTSGTDAQIAPNTGITGWNYSGLSKSITAEESAPSGLFFSPDGLNMYVNGSTGDDVNQYTLSTAWNVSTATYLQLFSTAAQDSVPTDIFFKPDGLAMFVLGDTNNTVFQYTLSSAWNISTASYASKSFSVASQETTPNGLWFKSDGTIMYVVGQTADTVFQYTLGTAWDVSTASYSGISFAVSAQEGTSNQVNLSADGLTMWILGASGDDINQYTLGTAWNVSTATFVNNFYIGFEDNNPQGLYIDSTANNKVFMLGTGTDTVYQYNTATNSISAVTDVFNTTSNARVQGNLAVQGSANIDAALIAGNLTVGTTTVSGTFTSTSTTALATSTGTQTTTFGAGATLSGSTKTMNIGTSGVSGSTTTISIGSAVSGATSTTTLSGLVVNSITAAVSAAGTTQAGATGLVSNINNVTVVAVGAAGVRLPTAVAGMRILIRNSDSADVLSIYPATGGQINALGANVASTLAAGLTTELVATTATQWYTF